MSDQDVLDFIRKHGRPELTSSWSAARLQVPEDEFIRACKRLRKDGRLIMLSSQGHTWSVSRFADVPDDRKRIALCALDEVLATNALMPAVARRPIENLLADIQSGALEYV